MFGRRSDGGRQRVGAVLGVALALVAPLATLGSPATAATGSWTAQFGTPALDIATAVVVAPSGETYVVGATMGSVYGPGSSLGGSLGGFDGFLAKYNAAGVRQWVTQFGTPGNDVPSGIALQGDWAIVTGWTTGSFSGASAGREDIFLINVGVRGAVEQKVYGATSFGTAGSDLATAVTVSAGRVYVTGSTSGSFIGVPSRVRGVEAFVMELNDGFGRLWTRQFGTLGTDSPTALAVSGSSIYITGSTTGTFTTAASSGQTDVFVAKYSTAGVSSWVRQFGTSSADEGRGIAVSGTSVFLAGSTSGTLIGRPAPTTGDGFVAKLDSAGTRVWTSQFGTSGADTVRGITLLGTTIYVAGNTTGSFPGFTNPGPAGTGDGFVSKFSSAGQQLSTRQFGSTQDDSVAGVSVINKTTTTPGLNSVVVAGTTLGRIGATPSAGGADIYLVATPR